MLSETAGCTRVTDPDRVDNVLLESDSGDPRRSWSGGDDLSALALG
jgi:hypothetical protein